MHTTAQVFIVLGAMGVLQFSALSLSVHQIGTVPVPARLRRRMDATVVRHSPLLAMASGIVLAAGVLYAVVGR